MLRSICYHCGSGISSGHWKTIKNVLNHWVICDDKKIEVLNLNQYSEDELLSIEDDILRSCSFLVYERCDEQQEMNSVSFSLLKNHDHLHQKLIIMDSFKASQYELTVHPNVNNPINIKQQFPSLNGKLYISSGEMPSSIIGNPPDPEWKLFTSFIKVGQQVFLSRKWKVSDVGSINRDETWRKIKDDNHLQADSNIQIAMNSEIIMNLYLNYLIQHRESIETKEFEDIVNKILDTHTQTEEEDNEENKGKAIIDSSDSDDDIAIMFESKIVELNNQIDDDCEDYNINNYDWRNRCEILNIQEILDGIKNIMNINYKNNEKAKEKKEKKHENQAKFH